MLDLWWRRKDRNVHHHLSCMNSSSGSSTFHCNYHRRRSCRLFRFRTTIFLGPLVETNNHEPLCHLEGKSNEDLSLSQSKIPSHQFETGNSPFVHLKDKKSLQFQSNFHSCCSLSRRRSNTGHSSQSQPNYNLHLRTVGNPLILSRICFESHSERCTDILVGGSFHQSTYNTCPLRPVQFDSRTVSIA